MVDLTSRYLGLHLRNPLVASSSPLTGDIETIVELEDAGAGAVVLRSLFEEQFVHESMDIHGMLERFADMDPEAASFFPPLPEFKTAPEAYLDLLRETKRRLRIPVIASLNGVSVGGWVRYARELQDAGADALELNVYHVAADPGASAAEVEQRYVDLVASVREVVSIPLAVKIGPYFSSLPDMAHRLYEAGADGLVLFNRFVQPDIDLDTLTIVPTVHLSTSEEVRLPLRWIAILRGHTTGSLAATSGVHTAEDALKVLLAGADVAMLASALLARGPSHLRSVLTGMVNWLEEREYDSVEQTKGSLSQVSSGDPAAFERVNYMKALTNFSTPLVPR